MPGYRTASGDGEVSGPDAGWAGTGSTTTRGPVRGYPPAPGQSPLMYPPGQFAAWNRGGAQPDDGADADLAAGLAPGDFRADGPAAGDFPAGDWPDGRDSQAGLAGRFGPPPGGLAPATAGWDWAGQDDEAGNWPAAAAGHESQGGWPGGGLAPGTDERGPYGPASYQPGTQALDAPPGWTGDRDPARTGPQPASAAWAQDHAGPGGGAAGVIGAGVPGSADGSREAGHRDPADGRAGGRPGRRSAA
ncbi:MAG: hypothetical protein ACLP52_04360, partial [Streptosporangiaceae bacterium]